MYSHGQQVETADCHIRELIVGDQRSSFFENAAHYFPGNVRGRVFHEGWLQPGETTVEGGALHLVAARGHVTVAIDRGDQGLVVGYPSIFRDLRRWYAYETTKADEYVVIYAAQSKSP